jgi:hypothetical protein
MTKFCGHRTGFNRSGAPNDAAPRPDACDTNFTGRPVIGRPGKLKSTPALSAATSAGNRRLAKSNNASDAGGTPVRGTNAFSKRK